MPERAIKPDKAITPLKVTDETFHRRVRRIFAAVDARVRSAPQRPPREENLKTAECRWPASRLRLPQRDADRSVLLTIRASRA